MKANKKKEDLRSAVFITLSLILMAGSLYVGLVKGRTEDAERISENDGISYGLEDLVTGDEFAVAGEETEEVRKEPENEDASVNDGTDLQTEVKTEDDDIEENLQTVLADSAEEEKIITLKRPVSSGRTVMAYSYDTEPVYSVTFGEYRSDHAGVDYAAKEGEEVFAAADGVVTDVYEDERLGCTVIVSHDGFETGYSNLQRGMFVEKGDEVTPLTVLGRVGDTAVYESGEESHLHFSLYVDGKSADPEKYVK